MMALMPPAAVTAGRACDGPIVDMREDQMADTLERISALLLLRHFRPSDS